MSRIPATAPDFFAEDTPTAVLVRQVLGAIAQFEKLPLRVFSEGEGIDTGALVQLQSGRETSYYFLGPRAGGTEVLHQKNEILVITPESPLGSQLLGRKQGEKCQLQLAGEKLEHTVVKVW